MNLSKITLAMSFAFALSSGSASADVQSQLNSMFNNMSNTTQPGAYETATRGVLSGGSFRTRNQIANTPLFSFRPPSAQGGCGGIDMFAGSFSFINAQQFVQTLRSVASNAVGVASGYAFKLALEQMAPSVAGVITDLQKTMQALNQYAGNSCQLATGLVTNTMDALVGKKTMDEAVEGMTGGLGDTFASIWSTNESGKNPTEKINDAGLMEFCKNKGNILWCEMQRQGVSNSFAYGNRQTQEMIMSLTGSVYVGELVNADDNKGKSNEMLPIPPTGVKLIDLIEGSDTETVAIYDCSGDTTACSDKGANISTKAIPIEGLGTKVAQAFNGKPTGAGASSGIVYKWARNTGTFTAAEQQIIAGMQRNGMSAMVQRMAQRSENMARLFVAENANILARDMVTDLATSYLLSASQAMVGSKMPMTEMVTKQIDDALARINREHSDLISKYGSTKNMTQQYESLMKIMPATASYKLPQGSSIPSAE